MVHSAARLVAAGSTTNESNIFGISRAGEPLAEIKLNPISVEQFLAAAKSLADNNASIQSDLMDAIERARSSALLIDHLRALFSHQQAVEFVSGGVDNEISLYLSASNAPNATTNTLRLSDQQQQQHTQNLALFSYSNQRTLIKAAKLLIASVAKILYLADSIVLQSCGVELDYIAGIGPAAEQRNWQKEDISMSARLQQQHRTDLISNRSGGGGGGAGALLPALAYPFLDLGARAAADTIRTAGSKYAAASLAAASLAEQVSSLA